MRNPGPAPGGDNRPGDLRRSLPGVFGAFDELSRKVLGSDGALQERERHLVAVALAIASRCDRSVQKRLADALAAGVPPREIVECGGITIHMGAEVAAAYAPQALALLESASVPEQPDLTLLRRKKKPDKKPRGPTRGFRDTRRRGSQWCPLLLAPRGQKRKK